MIHRTIGNFVDKIGNFKKQNIKNMLSIEDEEIFNFFYFIFGKFQFCFEFYFLLF